MTIQTDEKSATDTEKNALNRKLEEKTKLELERRRAMASGQFSFLDESAKNVLDESPSLHEVVKEWRASNRDEQRKRVRIQYEAAQVSDDGENTTKSLRRTKGYESLNLPKAGETFVVVWVTSKGQVVVDKDVMLLNMKEVIATKEDRPDISGPKGPKFAFVERSDESDSDSASFDLDLFWSVGFLFKHFKSCGLMKWDRQMGEVRSKGNKRRNVGGKYQGKLIGWKGTYGFLQCTSGDHFGKTIFLHHSDIVSPYLHLVKGLEFRFNVVKDSEGEKDDLKLRAIKAQPCLCEYSCAVHEGGNPKEVKKTPNRRRRRSSKSSTKLNSSGEAATNSSIEAGSPSVDVASPTAGDGEKRAKGKRRRSGQKQRKARVEAEAVHAVEA